MRPGLVVFAACAAAAAIGGVFYLFRDDTGVAKETLNAPLVSGPSPQAMVPWRNPAADIAAFFPGAPLPDASSPKIVALSRRRAEIIKRLGPDSPLDSNALYVFPVAGRGTVLLRRASGEYGAIEVVLGVDTARKVVGVRLQRHREPPEIAAALTADSFLSAFRGKTAVDGFTLGGDLPAVPAVAQKSAAAVARAIRALLIEYDAGARP